MSVKRHLDAARRGTAALNALRQRYPAIKIDLSGANLSGFNLNRADLSDANLTNCTMSGGSMSRADLRNASLDNVTFVRVDFCGAKLEGATAFDARFDTCAFEECDAANIEVYGSFLENCSFDFSDLSGASIRKTNVKSVSFRLIATDSKTLLDELEHDKGTDFTGAQLDSCRIVPALRIQLEYYSRRAYWEDWYASKGILKANFAKAFWSVSDYGHSTRRLARSCILALAFYSTLNVIPNALGFQPAFDKLSSTKGAAPLWQCVETIGLSIYCTICTITTLGYGDMAPITEYGRLVAIATVLTGFFLLGATLSRVANLFQTHGKPVPRPKIVDTD